MAAAVVACVATVALWTRGWVSTLPVILVGGIYFGVQQSADAKVKALNSYQIGRSPKA